MKGTDVHKAPSSQAILTFREFKELRDGVHDLWDNFSEPGVSQRPSYSTELTLDGVLQERNTRRNGARMDFASVSESVSGSSLGRNKEKALRISLSERADAKPGAIQSEEMKVVVWPSIGQFVKHPLALLGFVPKDLALFIAGAGAGAAAKTVTAPLDRIKLLMQTHGIRATQESSKRGIGFIEATAKIGKEEGIKGYWKGNLPQVIRIIPYSAVQLFVYEVYKKLFKGQTKELSIVGRLAAGACAGMTSTLVTYPLDVIRLRLAVDPTCKTMSQVAINMLREEGFSSFYRGLGPSLLGIAPYIAVNFCVFDLVKKSLPEDYRKKTEASFATAIISASFATIMCYPLDTVRRQMQMRGSPYKTVLDAFPGILARDGIIGLYRGFVPNALKNLPNSRYSSFSMAIAVLELQVYNKAFKFTSFNSLCTDTSMFCSIRLTTFDAAKMLIQASQKELQRIIEANHEHYVDTKI